MNHDVLPAAQVLVRLHDELLQRPDWPTLDVAPPPNGAWPWIVANHRCNRLLWLEEDLARREQVRDADIVANKRSIDRHNQARNDAVERIDEVLLMALNLVERDVVSGEIIAKTHSAQTRLNSETAGSMIDRMSIMALKVHAMRAQTERVDVDTPHIEASLIRLTKLEQQRADLGQCLDALIADVLAGRAYFKVYRQFKMYNDPRFNPALVAEAKARR